DSRALLFRGCDHHLARLVHQANDPTLPHEAWVIRKSAKLFLGFAPWAHKAFSARWPRAANWGRLPLTPLIVSRRRPGVPTRWRSDRRAVADDAVGLPGEAVIDVAVALLVNAKSDPGQATDIFKVRLCMLASGYARANGNERLNLGPATAGENLGNRLAMRT